MENTDLSKGSEKTYDIHDSCLHTDEIIHDYHKWQGYHKRVASLVHDRDVDKDHQNWKMFFQISSKVRPTGKYWNYPHCVNVVYRFEIGVQVLSIDLDPDWDHSCVNQRPK